jgi:hypothetical protein
LACIALVGCADFGKTGSRLSALTPDGYTGPVVAPSQIPATGTLPDGCVRLDSSQIGKTVTVTIDGTRKISVEFWIAKTGKSDQYVQFSFTPSGPVAYAVKAGTQTYYGTALMWMHPELLNPTALPSDVKGISDITFCAVTPGTGGAAPAAPAPPPSTSTTPTVQSTGTTGTTASTGGGYGGAACTANLQCWSGECLNNKCSLGWSFDRCVDGTRDCVSGQCTVLGCAPIPNGERAAPCTSSLQCWSGACVLGFCQGGDIGDACRSHSDCKLGYFCSSGTCQVAPPTN